MSQDTYDLTKLKEYVDRTGLMEKFTSKEQKDIETMAKQFEKYLKDSDTE